MRWLPRSMVGQLFALLLVAMTITHLSAILMPYRLYTTKEVHALSVREIQARVAAVYRAVVEFPQETNKLITAMSFPDTLFEVLPAGKMIREPMDEQEASLAQRLRTRLSLGPETPIYIALTQRKADDPQAKVMNRTPDFMTQPEIWVMDIELSLPDGSVLHSRHLPAMMSNKFAGIWRFSIPLGLLPLLIIAFFFGRRMVRQLQVLTDAARRIRRGERIGKVPAEGPDDIREVIEAFNDMQEHVMRYVSDRTRMLAAIGHDLRTPLTSLRIRAELIDDEELRKAMIQSMDEMSAMIDATLRFAQDEATQEPTQEVDLGELLNEAVEDQIMLGRQVTCEAPSGIRYCCRPVHLKRAFNNLMDNAVRYGNVSVRLLPGNQEQGHRIEVDDNGPGIAADKLEQVFEPFVRLDSGRNQATGGTGLGLANARSCVRAHGGEVSLHNRPEGGLQAVIILPVL